MNTHIILLYKNIIKFLFYIDLQIYSYFKIRDKVQKVVLREIIQKIIIQLLSLQAQLNIITSSVAYQMFAKKNHREQNQQIIAQLSKSNIQYYQDNMNKQGKKNEILEDKQNKKIYQNNLKCSDRLSSKIPIKNKRQQQVTSRTILQNQIIKIPNQRSQPKKNQIIIKNSSSIKQILYDQKLSQNNQMNIVYMNNKKDFKKVIQIKKTNEIININVGLRIENKQVKQK